MCIAFDTLYEDVRHNCCFVGFDETRSPRYAMLRSSDPSRSFLQEVAGSDKRYSFSLPPTESTKLYITESAIDALSLYVLREFAPDNYLSIAGANTPRGNMLPLALEHYLAMHQQIESICLCLDNDRAGIQAAKQNAIRVQHILHHFLLWENLSTRSSRLFSFQYTHGSGELVRWVPGIPPFSRYLSRQVPLTRSLYIGN